MVIIQLAGGLGNQMFQYALYLQLKSLGKEVKIDETSGFMQDKQRTPALAPFGVTYEKASQEEIQRMLDASPLWRHRIRRKLRGREKKSYFEEDKLFQPEIFTWDDIYLEGYWQTEKYFASVAKQVREAYDPDRLLAYLENRENTRGVRTAAYAEGLEKYLREIEDGQSVGVHLRGGDYLTPDNQALFGNICTGSYYRQAMERLRGQYPDCSFYLFTNDKAWAGSIDGGALAQALRLVELPEDELGAYGEFVLMSRCKHNILANSSFSWWASYLNRNPDKKVYAPGRWLNGWDCRDFYRADMEKIN
ncbi:MAG: alpha-1,2-fucosyltransferase [Clostridiales bacterium]|nr:alpha-1,2-fucosyltransferase [Clostridiales bacterium]